MADSKITVAEGVTIVESWLDDHFPGDPRAHVPQRFPKPHLWKVMPGPHGPGFQIAVGEDLLQRSGMLVDRLETVAQGTSAQKPGHWVVVSTRGIERSR